MSAAIGQPWHGRYTYNATDGYRLRKDADGLTLTASDSIQAWDLTPDTVYIRRPGLPDPQTPSSIVAQGGELRNYAIVAGKARQLSPKRTATQLGQARWVYFDPAGVPWWMEITQPGPTDAPVTGTPGTTRLTGNVPITVRTLGRAGVLTPGYTVPAPRVVANLTVAAPGFHQWLDWYNGYLTYSAAALVQSPAGNKATIRTRATSDNPAFTWLLDTALIEITISGTGGADGSGLSASAAILYETPATTNFVHHIPAWGYYPSGAAWKMLYEQEYSPSLAQWDFRLYLGSTLLQQEMVDEWTGNPAFSVEAGIYGVWWGCCRYSNNTVGLVKLTPNQPFVEGSAVTAAELYIDDIYGAFGESAAPGTRNADPAGAPDNNVIWGPSFGARFGGTSLLAIPAAICAAYDWRAGAVAVEQFSRYVSFI